MKEKSQIRFFSIKTIFFIFKVAWVRVDTQTILTIHNSIITRNQRVSLSHREHKEWKLHISNSQETDRGWYMCQVNTDPMRSRRGYLEVQGDHCDPPTSPDDECLSQCRPVSWTDGVLTTSW